MAMMRTITRAASPPLTTVSKLCPEAVLVVGASEHSSSLRDDIATEHSESTIISAPLTMILAPPLTHCSIREMSVSLSLSEVPSSLARYVMCVWDSAKQANICLSMMSLSHSLHDIMSCSTTALVILSSSLEICNVNIYIFFTKIRIAILYTYCDFCTGHLSTEAQLKVGI